MIATLKQLRRDCLGIADMIHSPASEKRKWLEYAEALGKIVGEPGSLRAPVGPTFDPHDVAAATINALASFR